MAGSNTVMPVMAMPFETSNVSIATTATYHP
jgi:hypothetical protein